MSLWHRRLHRETLMPTEVDVFGFFVPILLLVLVLCVVLFVILDLVLAGFGLYRYAWHPSLFRVTLFVALFCGFSLLIQR